jgi:hypothetical protein
MFSFLSLLSTNFMYNNYKNLFQNNETEIPLFFIKALTLLTTIKRSSGDLYYYDIEDVKNFNDCKSFLLSIEEEVFSSGFNYSDSCLSECQSRNENKIKNELAQFFKAVDKTNDLDALVKLILYHLNVIVRCNTRIFTGASASTIVSYCFDISQDSRIYGPRAYRSYQNYFILSNNVSSFNLCYAGLSKLFFNNVHMYIDGQPFKVEGLNIDSHVFNFDFTPSNIEYLFMLQVIKSLSSYPDSGSPSGDKKQFYRDNNNKRSKLKAKNGILGGKIPEKQNSNGENPRGFSSSSRASPALQNLNFEPYNGDNFVVIKDSIGNVFEVHFHDCKDLINLIKSFQHS